MPDSVLPADAAGRGRLPLGELRAALDALFSRAGSSHRRSRHAAIAICLELRDRRSDRAIRRRQRPELVCKDTGEAAMLPEARRIKPRFLHHPLREIATYERILAAFAVGAPRFYGSVVDRRARYCLFLERVRGVPLTEVGDFDVWRQVSGWLAGMRPARARARPGGAAALVPLVQYDRANARGWMERAQQHLEAARHSHGRSAATLLLASRHEVSR